MNARLIFITLFIYNNLKPFSQTTVLIDARHVNKTIDGLGRYVIELLNGLSALTLPRVVVMHTQEFPFHSLKNPNAFQFHQLNIKGGSPIQHLVLPFTIKKLQADVYFYPFIDPPFFSPAKRNIFSVHDLNHFFFSRYAATENKLAILMAKFFINTSSWKYSKVVVFSNFVKKQLENHVPASKNKSVIIYHGYSPLDEDNTQSEVLENSLMNKKFLLYIGNNRPHKNLDRLFHAFELLNEQYPEIHLVVAGNQIPRFFNIDKMITERKLQAKVKRINKPSNAYLALLYQSALLVVYPSVSEGFGFPLLEAWAFKVPIATSDSSCLPEIAGDAAAYFNPFSPNEIKKTIGDILESKAFREQLIKNGSERLRQYSWDKSAREHLELFMNNES